MSERAEKANFPLVGVVTAGKPMGITLPRAVTCPGLVLHLHDDGDLPGFLCAPSHNIAPVWVVLACVLAVLCLWCYCCCTCCSRGGTGRGRCGKRSASLDAALLAAEEGIYRGALKTGWMSKQGHVRKSWKRRFFVLESTVLLYYERPSDTKPKGQVLLDGITITMAARKGKPHCFGVHHPTRQPYFISASSEAEMLQWVRAIRRSDKVSLVDFEVLAKLGQGNFGKVLLVRKRFDASTGHDEAGIVGTGNSDDGAQQLPPPSPCPLPPPPQQYYAMKVLSKAKILRQADVDHARNERAILQVRDCIISPVLIFVPANRIEDSL